MKVIQPPQILTAPGTTSWALLPLHPPGKFPVTYILHRGEGSPQDANMMHRCKQGG